MTILSGIPYTGAIGLTGDVHSRVTGIIRLTTESLFTEHADDSHENYRDSKPAYTIIVPGHLTHKA